MQRLTKGVSRSRRQNGLSHVCSIATWNRVCSCQVKNHQRVSSSKQSVAKIFANLNFLLQKAASAFFDPIECHKVSSAALKHFKSNKSKWVTFTSTNITKTSIPILAQDTPHSGSSNAGACAQHPFLRSFIFLNGTLVSQD